MPERVMLIALAKIPPGLSAPPHHPSPIDD